MNKVFSGALTLYIAIFGSLSIADIVVPKDTVTSSVTIRAEATTDSATLGNLLPGEQLNYIESIGLPSFH